MASPRRPLSLPRRVVYSLLALVAFFLALEVALWGVANVAYWWKVGRLNPPGTVAAAEGRPFRIVSFGDSVTAGQGTAPRYSYPRQLEEVLNAGAKSGKFEVINNGVFALNSSRLADLLPGWLEEFKPDLIVVMSGCNNAWNYRNSHLEKLGLIDRPRWKQLLDRTRTYRFLRVMLKRSKTGFGIAEEQAPPPVLRDNMRISESVSPAVDPTAKTLERQDQLFRDAGALDKLLEYDLGIIRDLARQKSIPVVLMSYPFKPPYQDHRGLTLRFGKKNGFLTVDNHSVFQDIKKQRPDIELFSADRGHPNATGYRVVATNIYRALYAARDELGLDLAEPADPLAAFKDKAYLTSLYEEVERSTMRAEADEYVWETLGHVAMELDDWPAAEAAFLTAFDKSKGAPQFYESLGNLYVQRKDWDALDRLKERMLAMRSNRSDIQFLMEMFSRQADMGRRGLDPQLGGGEGRRDDGPAGAGGGTTSGPPGGQPDGAGGGPGEGGGSGPGGGQGEGPGEGPAGGTPAPAPDNAAPSDSRVPRDSAPPPAG
jgi:lysophospholipase L1-like esterase